MKTKIKKPPKVKVPKSETFIIKKEFLTRSYGENFKHWSVGIKILSELFELVKDISFWRVFTVKYPIFWMRGEAGKSFLLNEYEKFLKGKINEKLVSKPQEKTYTLQDTKVGADYEQLATKPKTLQDFLS